MKTQLTPPSQPPLHIAIDVADLYLSHHDNATHMRYLDTKQINPSALKYIKNQLAARPETVISFFFHPKQHANLIFQKNFETSPSTDCSIIDTLITLTQQLKQRDHRAIFSLIALKCGVPHFRPLFSASLTLPSLIISSHRTLLRTIIQNYPHVRTHCLYPPYTLTLETQDRITNRIKHHLRKAGHSVNLFIDIDYTVLDNDKTATTGLTTLNPSLEIFLKRISRRAESYAWKKRLQITLLTARLKRHLDTETIAYEPFPDSAPEAAPNIIRTLLSNIPNLLHINGTLYSEEYRYQLYKGDFICKMSQLISSPPYSLGYLLLVLNTSKALHDNKTLNILIDDNINQCKNFIRQPRKQFRHKSFYAAHVKPESDFSSSLPQDQLSL